MESAAHESSSKRGMPAFSAKVLAWGVGKWGPRGGHVTLPFNPRPCSVVEFGSLTKTGGVYV